MSVESVPLAFWTSDSGFESTVETTHLRLPSSRTIFVRRRVSTPSIATTPLAASQSGSELVARRFDGIELISFITKASGHAAPLSSSSATMP